MSSTTPLSSRTLDLLSGYQSSSDDESPANSTPVVVLPRAINSAPVPMVPLAVLRSGGGGNNRSLVLATKLNDNGPIQGPAALHDPTDRTASFLRAVDVKTGSTSMTEANAGVDDFAFSKNRNAFQRGKTSGGEDDMALAPGAETRTIQRNDYGYERYSRGVLINSEAMAGEGIDDDVARANAEAERQLVESVKQKRALVDPYNWDGPPKSRRARMKQERTSEGPLVITLDDELSHGVWAPPSVSERALTVDSTPMIEEGVELHPRIQRERIYLAERDRQRGIHENDDNEKEKYDRMVERKMSHLLPPRLAEDAVAIEAVTTFHGDEDVDYRGRSWNSPPPGVKGADLFDMDDHSCFVPKKCVHRFTGHEKGVHRIRLSPRTGHLLLSAGLDGACKVWSIEHRKCMRTYVGHTAAVRDVQFNNDGSKFVSASFDRYLRLWKVETGEVLGTYTNRRVPYVVKFYPKDDNIFVVGCSDNKIVAYDSTTGEITQEYDHHLAPVNTITFVEDNGMKMVTSSDDKKVLVWEWDIGVPIKYISDPTMHSMPVITMHPSEKFLLCQSLDNRIVVYQAGERYGLQRKKKMEGHNVAGYACDIAISPDGRFVCSGDSNGKLFFWDFKRTRILQKFHAHDKGPSIGAVWHPVEPATVLTCGWDGVIKMWQ
jgi:pre-mRNA-processing factor 17